MDFLPFMLFIMVCLLSLQGIVSGKPATEADLKDPCAQNCVKELRSKNYCTQNFTGNGYPSVEELQKLYNDNIGKFDFRPHFNETVVLSGKNICRSYYYYVKDITAIRDEHDNIRCTLYIPGLYDISIPVQECNPHASRLLPRKYSANHIECVQKSYQYPFIVLSQDKKSLELVNIKGVYSSCDLIQY